MCQLADQSPIMNLNKIIGFGVRIVLTLVFLTFVIVQILKLMGKEVGTRTFSESNPTFPSVAICPYSYNQEIVPPLCQGKNFTFADAMKLLPSIRDHLEIIIMYDRMYDHSSLYVPHMFLECMA